MTELLCLLVGLTAGFFIYRQGLMDGQGVKADKPIPALKIPFSTPTKPSKAELELAKSWENLMAFDGNPQVPLKEGD